MKTLSVRILLFVALMVMQVAVAHAVAVSLATLNLPVQTNGEVYAVARQADGKILIGGYFQYVNGVLRNNIARLNVDGTLDTAWDANVDGQVLALAVDGSNNIYAAGGFVTIGGQTRNRIAQLNATTGAATTWNANANVLYNRRL